MCASAIDFSRYVVAIASVLMSSCATTQAPLQIGDDVIPLLAAGHGLSVDFESLDFAAGEIDHHDPIARVRVSHQRTGILSEDAQIGALITQQIIPAGTPVFWRPFHQTNNYNQNSQTRGAWCAPVQEQSLFGEFTDAWCMMRRGDRFQAVSSSFGSPFLPLALNPDTWRRMDEPSIEERGVDFGRELHIQAMLGRVQEKQLQVYYNFSDGDRSSPLLTRHIEIDQSGVAQLFVFGRAVILTPTGGGRATVEARAHEPKPEVSGDAGEVEPPSDGQTQ